MGFREGLNEVPLGILPSNKDAHSSRSSHCCGRGWDKLCTKSNRKGQLALNKKMYFGPFHHRDRVAYPLGRLGSRYNVAAWPFAFVRPFRRNWFLPKINFPADWESTEVEGLSQDKKMKCDKIYFIRVVLTKFLIKQKVFPRAICFHYKYHKTIFKSN